MAKFMIIGLDDPYDKTPLQPDIIGSSGCRLYKMSGLPMLQYCRAFDLRNLFEKDDHHTDTVGRIKATRIIASLDTRYATTYIVCMGRMVARAFGLENTNPLTFVQIKRGIFAAYLPHTSGLNRWYNDDDNARRANEFMQTVGAVASGEIKEDDIEHAMSK